MKRLSNSELILPTGFSDNKFNSLVQMTWFSLVCLRLENYCGHSIKHGRHLRIMLRKRWKALIVPQKMYYSFEWYLYETNNTNLSWERDFEALKTNKTNVVCGNFSHDSNKAYVNRVLVNCVRSCQQKEFRHSSGCLLVSSCWQSTLNGQNLSCWNKRPQKWKRLSNLLNRDLKIIKIRYWNLTLIIILAK